MRRIALACLTLVGLAAMPNYIGAQGYPNRPIHIVVPFPPGGAANDMRARIIADKLSQSLGRQVVVENKPGADGAIGTEFVAKSAPDGYTVLLTEKGLLTVNPVLFRKMRYDPVKDFEHVTQIITTTVVLAANPSLPASSVANLIALAKAKPGQLNYGTGISTHYLIMEMFKLRTGTNMAYVPYKGSPPAVMALMSDQTQVMFGTLQSMLPQIKANKIKALAARRRCRRCPRSRKAAFPASKRVRSPDSPFLPEHRKRSSGDSTKKSPGSCACPMSRNAWRRAGTRSWAAPRRNSPLSSKRRSRNTGMWSRKRASRSSIDAFIGAGLMR
jgi:tripartite-type tricarboxylate transporter receptor subunit TctC